MVELYGKKRTRREVEAHAGSSSQFAGVRLMTLGDGGERGVRLLEFRTGTGLRFTVMVDRGFDIGECEYRGIAIGWHSPTGFKHPAYADYEGEGGLGWLRTFSGLLATCGLDHILPGYDEPADHFNYPGRKVVHHAIHGRAANLPARLAGYGERWEGDNLILWCEGIVTQATVFGENLQLTRRIEVSVGTNEIRLHDVVSNRGFYRTPHMYMYHVNVGHPVLSEGSRYLAPIDDVVWAGHAGADYRKQEVGYRIMPPPQERFREQVWQHQLAANAAGEAPVALVNDALGIGFEIVSRKDQFPCMYQWQNMQAGMYVLGMEPSTHHVLGHEAARERGEMIWLEHGEERRYDVTFRVLAGECEIATAEKRIAGIAKQPAKDFPEPSNNHVSLRRNPSDKREGAV
jgi:hypothetical protein